ncbi:MAG TPA: hypothetical protein VL475_15405, partial [Planctomycetaceae bacterium]|nr:hypothetical protein [Planctomycetaceae bacterium]
MSCFTYETCIDLSTIHFMAFEINLPARLVVWTLRCAGMDTAVYHQRSMDVDTKKAPIPFEVFLPYFLADPPIDICITKKQDGRIVRLKISAPDSQIEGQIQKYMERYSVENDGEAVADCERKALWKQICALLQSAGMSYH